MIPAVSLIGVLQPDAFVRASDYLVYHENMYRRLIFPVVAMTAWAQQPDPGAAAAEASLRARAEEFFQLQVAKKYRQAESLVAEGSKDAYYGGSGQYNIPGFTIEKVELLGDSRAIVTIHTKATVMMPGVGPIQFDAPVSSNWKLEAGQWVLDVNPGGAIPTPFGAVTPSLGNGAAVPLGLPGKAVDPASLKGLVKIDRNSVVLTTAEPTQTVTVSNNMPGPVDVDLSSDNIDGLTASLDKKHLESGEKSAIRFQSTGKGTGSGSVRLLVSPLATQLDIAVTVK